MPGTLVPPPMGTRPFPRLHDSDKLAAAVLANANALQLPLNGPLPTKAHPTDSAGSSEDERGSPVFLPYSLRAIPPPRIPPPKVVRPVPEARSAPQQQITITVSQDHYESKTVVNSEDNSYLDLLPDLGEDYESDTSLRSIRSVRSVRSVRSSVTVAEVQQEVMVESLPPAPATHSNPSTPVIPETDHQANERDLQSRASELSIVSVISHEQEIDPFEYLEDAIMNHGTAFDELDVDVDLPDLRMPSPIESNTSDEEESERELSDGDENGDEDVSVSQSPVAPSVPITKVLEVLESGLSLSVKFIDDHLEVDNLSALHVLGNKSLLLDFTAASQRKLEFGSRVRGELFGGALKQLQQCAKYPGRGGRRTECECYQDNDRCNIPSHGIVAALLCPEDGRGDTRYAPNSLQLRLEGGGKRVSHGHWAPNGDEERMADIWLLPANDAPGAQVKNLLKDVLDKEMLLINRRGNSNSSSTKSAGVYAAALTPSSSSSSSNNNNNNSISITGGSGGAVVPAAGTFLLVIAMEG
ncbi:hypothetical protein BDZ88DRAFT_221759 [Geranomyces variabilis]|nr:hypothetical protein BDZ88DRAFT_221759 [Geranomyces variabilis]KAJ3139503.1 hypothetical protein HDU90_009004 [Geranomyces variabilis]